MTTQLESGWGQRAGMEQELFTSDCRGYGAPREQTNLQSTGQSLHSNIEESSNTEPREDHSVCVMEAGRSGVRADQQYVKWVCFGGGGCWKDIPANIRKLRQIGEG